MKTNEQDASLVAAMFLFPVFICLATVAQATTTSLPALPAGYEKWKNDHSECAVTKRDGNKVNYRRDLYERKLPEHGLFDGIAIHRFGGVPYYVTHFRAFHDGNGLLRGGPHSFVRTKNGKEWRFYEVPDTWKKREIISAAVDSYLSRQGTSTKEINDCLWAKR